MQSSWVKIPAEEVLGTGPGRGVLPVVMIVLAGDYCEDREGQSESHNYFHLDIFIIALPSSCLRALSFLS